MFSSGVRKTLILKRVQRNPAFLISRFNYRDSLRIGGQMVKICLNCGERIEDL